MMDVLRKLNALFNLGQTYWQQADSEYASQQKKSDATLSTSRERIRDLAEAFATQESELTTLRAELEQLRVYKAECEGQVPAVAVPDAEAAFEVFAATLGGVDTDAYHDYPADGLFIKGFEAGIAAAPSHSQQSATVPEANNIIEVKRVGDQSVQVTFASCRTAAVFERFILAASPSHESEQPKQTRSQLPDGVTRVNDVSTGCASPAPTNTELKIQVCKLGGYGKAYDLPQTKRAYTYADQPNNSGAHKLGKALQSASKASAGDAIDQGLNLLKSLAGEGFGVFESESAAPDSEGESV